MLETACTNEQKVKITAVPRTSTGRPAAVQGALRVSVIDGDGTFTQDAAEPLAFYAVSGDAAAVTNYAISADADLGEGEVLIEDTVALTVSSATAANFGLTAGAPEPK